MDADGSGGFVLYLGARELRHRGHGGHGGGIGFVRRFRGRGFRRRGGGGGRGGFVRQWRFVVGIGGVVAAVLLELAEFLQGAVEGRLVALEGEVGVVLVCAAGGVE